MSETPGEYKADSSAKPTETAPPHGPCDLGAICPLCHPAPPLDLEGCKRRAWERSSLEDWNPPILLQSQHDERSLVAEVERLRGLLERLADRPAENVRAEPENHTVYAACWCCLAWIENGDPHRADCPWPELEAAVLSWRKP